MRSDAKLKRLVPLVKELIAEGYHPIVFCRFIPTADYLAEHLRTALTRIPDLQIDAVTGNLAPEEREERVDALTAHDGPRLLIATDCLSEGINLQEGFTAVVHYDLAWNPTRHEQREGRIDRFGQGAPVVRTVTYFGEDNGIDGIVLEVLIRRHKNIQRSTGVSVPVPVDPTTVMKAIWESLLLRGKDAEQLTLDFAEATSASLADEVQVQWVNAAEREKASRSRFRQAGLKPDVVEHAIIEVRRALGGPPKSKPSLAQRYRFWAPRSPTPRTGSRPASTPCRRRYATSFRRPRTIACISTGRCQCRPGTACSTAPIRRWSHCPAMCWTPRSTAAWTRPPGPRGGRVSCAPRASTRSRRCWWFATGWRSPSRVPTPRSPRSPRKRGSPPSRQAGTP
ncbi:helicase domain protein [Mycobacterium kansasii]|uniref:Helicase domain protein n=1 Tax=Mycobacterium kansasii TaxID=1768 RepID=A0A1V3WJF8_MYCKA|nr:helicase domain protein [Mycobacterium kansasii]